MFSEDPQTNSVLLAQTGASGRYLNHFFVRFSLQSSVCGKIMELLGQNKIDHHQRQVAILSQDSFYKVLTPEQKAKALKGQFNFDHPGKLGAGFFLRVLISIPSSTLFLPLLRCI